MSPITDPDRLDRLLDRQAKLWEVRRRLAEKGGEAAREKLAHLAEGPWITVSKQLGSGGVALAERIGERLGWQVFDKQILESIARETHTRDRVLAHLDGHAVGWIEDYLAHLIVPGDPGRAAFHREMVRVICALARQGHAVLVGRGANWLLDSRYGLRLRVVLSLEDRVRAVAEHESLEPAAARRRIHQDDAGQAAFIRQVYRREIDDATGYDLVVNFGALERDTAADVAITALIRKLGGAGDPRVK